MVGLKEITLEYIGALDYVEEIVREVEMPHGSDIKAIIGPRRVGKTFLMLKKAKNMLENGENVLYLPLDEPELARMEARELAEEVRKEYPSGKVTLFLDEVQEWGTGTESSAGSTTLKTLTYTSQAPRQHSSPLRYPRGLGEGTSHGSYFPCLLERLPEPPKLIRSGREEG